MKKFLQENRTFIVIALTITILALLKVGTANAQTGQTWKPPTTAQWMAAIEKDYPNVMQEYNLASGNKILGVCVRSDGTDYKAWALYFTKKKEGQTFNGLLSSVSDMCPYDQLYPKMVIYQK